MSFTQDEINLLCVFDTADRGQLIEKLSLALPYVEDADLKEMSAAVLDKLAHMTDAEFSKVELLPTAAVEDME